MLSIKVVLAIPLPDMQVLAFFEDGKTKKFDVKNLLEEYPEFEALKNPDLFNLLSVEPGGYGISWNEDLDCSEGELYENGADVDLSLEDFIAFSKYGLMTGGEASTYLNCTRQNLDDLIKRGKIHPVRTFPNGKMFLKSEIEHRTW